MSGDLVDRWRLLVAANCDQGLSPAAKAVLAQILDHFNGKTGQCTPSLDRLARTTNLSRRSAIRGVNELCATGWIERDRAVRDGGRSFVANSFKPAFERGRGGPDLVTGLSPPSDKPVTTSKRRGSDRAVTRGGDNPDTKVVTGLSPKPSKRTKEGRTKSESIDPSAFGRFWQAYPRKVGKAAAERVFLRILRDGKATADELIAGAERYRAERSREDPTYTKHPQTWLNAASWLDEPAPRAAPPRSNGRQPFSAIDALMRNLDHDE